MKKLLPLALIAATLFACNTHTDKESAGTAGNSKDVLWTGNIYNIYEIRLAMGTGDAAASQKIFARALDAYVNKKDLPAGIDLFKSAICREPSAKAYFELGSALADGGFYDESVQALHIAEQLGYTPLANLMYRMAQAVSNQNIAVESLRDSLMLHYMEVAIQMGYPHSEEFLRNGTFESLRRARNFQATFDEAIAAGPGSSSPGRLFWETFRRDFKQMRLPVIINTVWIQSHKTGASDLISYDYEKFITEMRNAQFSRDVEAQYYYTGLIQQDTNFTVLLYAEKNEELADANHYTPTSFILTSFDHNGKIIDKMRAAGQRDFTDTFRVFTIQPNLTFEIRDYKNIYKNDPESVGYEKNYVVRSEPLGVNDYRITPEGRFEKVDAPLAMR
ncbi:MAG TPA: hypothetical protein VHD83_20620 [Puia sp.]|nr:hypothetical protein [Puia sp.]